MILWQWGFTSVQTRSHLGNKSMPAVRIKNGEELCGTLFVLSSWKRFVWDFGWVASYPLKLSWICHRAMTWLDTAGVRGLVRSQVDPRQGLGGGSEDKTPGSSAISAFCDIRKRPKSKSWNSLSPVSFYLNINTDIATFRPFLWIRFGSIYRVSQEKHPAFDLMQVENDCIYVICFIFSESSYFNLKFGVKQSKIGWKFAEQWPTKAKIFGSTDDRQPDFIEKCTNSKRLY